jgi:phage gp29-like protein
MQNPLSIFAGIMAKKDRSSKKQDRAALETTQTAEVAWLANQWQEHPVVGMTPVRMHRLLTDAEQGNIQAQADLFCDMEERDGHIFSEMTKRKQAVNGLPWGVKPPKNATAQEKKIAEEVYEWLDDIEDFEMFLFEAMDAVGHGYSCQEIKWHQMGSLWLPESFEHTQPRLIMTPHNQPNELRLNDGSLEGVEFWPFGWFIHRHKAKSGYVSRSGLFRVLAWPFLFKNYGVRDIMEFLETYGLPSKIGKYPSGATAEEKMTLMRAVMSIGRNAGGIIPNGMSIDFEDATDGDTSNHMNLVRIGSPPTLPSTVLLATAQTALDEYAGFWADCRVYSPTEQLVPVIATVSGIGVDLSIVSQVIRDYFAELAPSEAYQAAVLTARIVAIANVTDVQLSPTTNIVPEVNWMHTYWLRLGTLTVSAAS